MEVETKFPWDNDEKPYFVNEEGFEWYFNKLGTEYARLKDGSGTSLKDVCVFYVKKDDDITNVIIDKNRKILADSRSLESIGVEIDKLKLLRRN
ncbi:hypothetical protein KAI32_03005 [Candidatus Pacearchaeota archaeon]|nr:hypothetical protein [Candidatus Pacearchaeota archaeon]